MAKQVSSVITKENLYACNQLQKDPGVLFNSPRCRELIDGVVQNGKES